MNIGVPKERRPYEFRVGLTPTAVQMLAEDGLLCYVEHNAGVGAGFSDQEYEQAGARVVYSSHEVFGRADLLLKVGRPTLEELEWIRPQTTLMGLLHLASSRLDKIKVLQEKQITAIPYEQITLADGSVPVRKSLSQIGGRLAAQICAHLLQNDGQGKGLLLGGIAGVPPAQVAIIGAGVFGTYATRAFVGMGAHVTVLDTNYNALMRINDEFPNVTTLMSNPINIKRVTGYADVVVGAIFIPGARTPIVLTRDMVRAMKPNSLIMDVSIDEGGCVETSHPTSHDNPTYLEEGVLHYCVPNIPSIVARTSTIAFLNAAFPFIQEIALKGSQLAIADNPAIEHGAAIILGQIRHIPQLRPISG